MPPDILEDSCTPKKPCCWDDQPTDANPSMFFPPTFPNPDAAMDCNSSALKQSDATSTLISYKDKVTDSKNLSKDEDLFSIDGDDIDLMGEDIQVGKTYLVDQPIFFCDEFEHNSMECSRVW
ncbi:hypothetical protein V6N13_007884 [Hibiscus sabdariffa]|uniref:Uncharacterized protein n=1 Tax=Hibiscus sabdariffa TaxID=183260 RepID=A0ABR2EBN0_9ROSI